MERGLESSKQLQTCVNFSAADEIQSHFRGKGILGEENLGHLYSTRCIPSRIVGETMNILVLSREKKLV